MPFSAPQCAVPWFSTSSASRFLAFNDERFVPWFRATEEDVALLLWAYSWALGLAPYANFAQPVWDHPMPHAVFYENRIGGRALFDLTDRDMANLGFPAGATHAFLGTIKDCTTGARANEQ